MGLETSEGANDVNKASQPAVVTSYDSPALSSSPKTATLMMRRSSAGLDGQFIRTTVPVRANFEDIRQHLKHLGPSNPATNPKNTRSTTVKVKPGTGAPSAPLRSSSFAEPIEETPIEEGDETTSLLRPPVTAKDGIHALRQRYGSVSPAVTVQLAPQTNGIPALTLDAADQVDKSTQTSAPASQTDLTSTAEPANHQQQQSPQHPPPLQQPQQPQPQPRASSSSGSTQSLTITPNNNNKTADTTTALSTPKPRPFVRSGSITENVIESRGVRKVVLETTTDASTNDDDESSGAVITVASSASPEQGGVHMPPALSSHSGTGGTKLLSRGTFGGLFAGREGKDGKERDKGREDGEGEGEEEGGKQGGGEDEGEDEDEEELMSPAPGDEEEEEIPGNDAESVAATAGSGSASKGNASQTGGGGSKGGGGGDGGGGGKKKTRRKKRKGGKS